MELSLITASQVFIMFLLIVLGFWCSKANIIKQETKAEFSNFLMYIIVPAMIVNSYLTDFDKETFGKLISSFITSFLLILTGAIITLIVATFIKDKDKNLFKFACIFSNAGYMGFPLIQALFGEIGILYASAYFTVFNILLWTYGYLIMSNTANIKDIFKSISSSPVIISVFVGILIYLLQIPVPYIISRPIQMIGDMNTPISMIITGMTLATSNLLQMLKNKKIFTIIGVRLLLIPLISLLVVRYLPLDTTVAMVDLILEACPCAAITTMFAIKFKHNEQLGAGAVVITTLLSIVTLPLYSFLINLLL